MILIDTRSGTALGLLDPLDRSAKDPGAAAMYGVRGANGVIVVKTTRLPPPEL
jgi:TonB-dependent SusC/RagA subfamily outer membrane receptor